MAKKKLFNKTVKFPCGAKVEAKDKGYDWNEQAVVMFRITDPGQSFDNDGYQHTVSIAITRPALPVLIRLAKKAYKNTPRTRKRNF